jgi:HlyD family secretion protein
MPKSSKRKKIIVFSVIGLVLIGLTAATVLRKREVAITVQTEKVTRRNLTEVVVANGRIQPVVQVVISPEVAGEIIQLPVKEGSDVKKGDLLVQIKPDNYVASRNSAEAAYKSAVASRALAKAELDRAEAEFKRNESLFQKQLVSDSVFLDFKTAFEVAKVRFENALHASDQAKFALDRAVDDLSKTTILAPIDGRVIRLQSQLGERVLGTSFNKGTEILTVADVSEMEARVDIGEMDVVLIQLGQKARLEVDAFRDKKFTGVVTEIANSSKGAGLGSLSGGMGGQSQEATKFEVRIRVNEAEAFRPGMSVSCEIETRYRTNVLTVPIASVTTRLPTPATNKPPATVAGTNSSASTGNVATASATNSPTRSERKAKDTVKPVEVVFIVDGEKVKKMPVKIGISDEAYWEITDGLKEGDEVVSGGFRAIGRELEDGKKIRKGGEQETKPAATES